MMQLLDFEHDNEGNLVGVTVDYDGERIELERVRHGEWIHDINNLYGCSECFNRETMSLKRLKPYCPNCGAKMDGGKQDANV